MNRSLAIGILVLGSCAAWAQETPPKMVPPPAMDDSHPSGAAEKAVLAGGCYWGTQGLFEHVKGIKRVVAGFTGGHNDEDGGAESVQITFDPKVLSYGRLLQIFFSMHDPTQLNRQGPDVGSGYRSDIFYLNDEQHRIAQAYVAQLEQSKVFPKKIVTRIDPLPVFNPVDLSQQDYMIKNPHADYIEINDVPKVHSLKQFFPESYRAMPLQYW